MENRSGIFAKRLNIELSKINMTQTEFCKKTQISKGAFFNYKLGTRLPDTENLIKLAEELNCSTDYLLGFTDIKSSNGDYQTIHKITGLSDRSIEYLENASNDYDRIKTLNYLIENEETYHLLKNISNFLWKGNLNYNQQIDKDQAIAKVQIDRILFSMDNDIKNLSILNMNNKQDE